MTQEPAPDWATRLAQTIAGEVRRHRQRRKMSAQQLSDRCAELGMPIQRSVLANLESGRRTTVNVAEVLVLAAALDVSPGELIFPVGYSQVVEILPRDKREPLFGIDWIAGIKRLGEVSVKEAHTNPVFLAREHDDLMRRFTHAFDARSAAVVRLAELYKYKGAAEAFEAVMAESQALSAQLSELDTSTQDGVDRLREMRDHSKELTARIRDLASEADLFTQAQRNAENSHVSLVSAEARLKAFRKGMRRAGWEPPLLPSEISYLEPEAPTVADLENLPVLKNGELPEETVLGERAEEGGDSSSSIEDLVQPGAASGVGLTGEFAALVADAVVERLERHGLINAARSANT